MTDSVNSTRKTNGITPMMISCNAVCLSVIHAAAHNPHERVLQDKVKERLDFAADMLQILGTQNVYRQHDRSVIM